MTKYARDEFDKVPETSSRQGVHRVASDAPRRRLGPILAVGVVALAIGLVAFLFLPKLGFAPTGSPLMAAGSAQESPSAETPQTASQSAEPSADPSTTPPAGEALPTTGTPSTAPEDNAPAVDKSQPVAVYNGTATAGLAGRVSNTVSADGWTLGPVGNWGGMPQKSSVIYYSGAGQKANAEALGELLNITSLVDSAEFQQPVVVVLGPGFQ
ncbi:LytR C-terminal domain-containing protein [Arthrobacter sp. ISL-69]|uniref:LytR C-terminal domain-containing protein n=1 Tax=Arthrobacter sp. ISL-69 TaxID=2819113 RepID=UPI001BE88A84|nr:LytR C-terminal domain-containing protein [Arthrobacter sp. ISL-69]MBT2535206.1 LytR C-terminal domain-containing protein [Arthrobacter sp. ISL-69]